IQELVQEGLHAVTRYQPQSNKIMRMHAQTAMIENGLVRLPETAPWLAQYLHELTAFPKGRHDDQGDSTAQFLDWFKRGSRPSFNAGIWHLYKSGTKPSRPVVPSPRGPNRCRLWRRGPASSVCCDRPAGARTKRRSGLGEAPTPLRKVDFPLLRGLSQ